MLVADKKWSCLLLFFGGSDDDAVDVFAVWNWMLKLMMFDVFCNLNAEEKNKERAPSLFIP